MGRMHEPPMAEPLAYFLTWATYGTWLPGDDRGWVKFRKGRQLPDSKREMNAAARMNERACMLSVPQRQLVEKTITDHCEIRGWKLHAVNCRSNHVHVVATAHGRKPEIVREQFKAWCTRRLKEMGPRLRKSMSTDAAPVRTQWWAERGSDRCLNDDGALEQAIVYVRDCQD